jgi:hypothetical protein
MTVQYGPPAYLDAWRRLTPVSWESSVHLALVNLYCVTHNRRAEGFALSNDQIAAMEAVDRAIKESGT